MLQRFLYIFLDESGNLDFSTNGTRFSVYGRPPTVKAHSGEIKRLFARGISKREIAKWLKIGRTSVRRVLTQTDPRPIAVGTPITRCPRTDPAQPLANMTDAEAFGFCHSKTLPTTSEDFPTESTQL